MKKFLCFVFALAIMTGCTTASTVTIENKTMKVNAVTETAIQQLLSDLEGDFSIGEGYIPVSCDDLDNLEDSDSSVYPIYKNDELAYLLVCSKEKKLIDVDKEIETRIAKEHCYVEIDGRVYLASKSGNILLSGETETEEVKALLKKIDLFKMANIKPSSDGAVPIQKADSISDDAKVIIDGVEYSNRRITVTFVDGDADKCIKAYEAFCKGKLVKNMDSINSYTFEFAPSSAEDISKLLENTLKLDFVVKASLDGISSTQPVGNNSSMQ